MQQTTSQGTSHPPPLPLTTTDIKNSGSRRQVVHIISKQQPKSVIAVDGATEHDVLVRIGKARTAFLPLRPVWRSKELSQRTKRIFNTNVKSVLMYGAETRTQISRNSPPTLKLAIIRFANRLSMHGYSKSSVT